MNLNKGCIEMTSLSRVRNVHIVMNLNKGCIEILEYAQSRLEHL